MYVFVTDIENILSIDGNIRKYNWIIFSRKHYCNVFKLNAHTMELYFYLYESMLVSSQHFPDLGGRDFVYSRLGIIFMNMKQPSKATSIGQYSSPNIFS